MKTILKPIALIWISLYVFNCAAPTAVRLHPDFVANPERIASISILPPDTEVLYLVFSGDNHRLQEKEREIDSLFMLLLPEILASQEYKSEPYLFPEEPQQATEYRYTLEQFRTAYYGTLSEMYAKPGVSMKNAADYPGEVGPLVNQLGVEPDVDALLFLSYRGFKKSAGLLAKEMAGGVLLGVATGVVVVPLDEGGRLQAALVDATTGNVLWHNIVSGEGPIEDLLELAFKKFPNHNENLQAHIESGTEINHPFKMEHLAPLAVSDSLNKLDQAHLEDGRIITGKVIKVSKKNCVMSHRGTLYIINRRKIERVVRAGELVSWQTLEDMDFPRVNYNAYSEKEEIH